MKQNVETNCETKIGKNIKIHMKKIKKKKESEQQFENSQIPRDDTNVNKIKPSLVKKNVKNMWIVFFTIKLHSNGLQ